PTARSMSTLGLDTIRVPLASNTPPYRIDEVGEHDCYVRIRRPGPDLLALVPPGDCATGFRTRLISELQAHASRQIATRRLDGLRRGAPSVPCGIGVGLFHPDRHAGAAAGVRGRDADTARCAGRPGHLGPLSPRPRRRFG